MPLYSVVSSLLVRPVSVEGPTEMSSLSPNPPALRASGQAGYLTQVGVYLLYFTSASPVVPVVSSLSWHRMPRPRPDEPRLAPSRLPYPAPTGSTSREVALGQVRLGDQVRHIQFTVRQWPPLVVLAGLPVSNMLAGSRPSQKSRCTHSLADTRPSCLAARSHPPRPSAGIPSCSHLYASYYPFQMLL